MTRESVLDARIRAARASIDGHLRFIKAREKDIAVRRRTIARWEGCIADLERERAAMADPGRRGAEGEGLSSTVGGDDPDSIDPTTAGPDGRRGSQG